MTTDSQLTPEAVRVLKDYRRGKRVRARSGWLDKATAAAVVALLLLFSWYYVSQTSTTQGLQAADATHAAEISQIQTDLKGVCRKVPDPALTPGQQDACDRAENNIPPAPAIVPGPNGVTTDQVRAIVAAQLADAPAGLTVAQVTEIAAGVFAKNPPAAGKDGADATPAMVLAVVAQVCADNACRGPAGADGKNGADAPPAPDSQVAAQVQAYCDAHSSCTGSQGETGPAGRGIVDRFYQWDPAAPTQCQEVTDYSVEPSPVTLAVGSALCDGLPVPPPPATDSSSPPTT